MTAALLPGLTGPLAAAAVLTSTSSEWSEAERDAAKVAVRVLVADATGSLMRVEKLTVRIRFAA